MNRLRDLLRRLAARARRSGKLAAAIALSSTAAAALTARLDSLDVLGLRSADQSMYDRGLTRFTLHPQKSEDVVIVAVDDRTLQMVAASPSLRQAYGNWPYFRTAWLHLSEHLAAEGARAVVLDFTFDEPASDSSGDVLLGEGLARGRLPVYVGVAANPTGAPLPRVEPKNRFPQEIPPPAAAPTAASDEFVEAPELPPPTREQTALALAFPVALEGGLHLPWLHRERDLQGQLRVAEPLPPTAPVLPALAGTGLVEPEADSDGKMRRTRFAYTDGANTFATLSVAAAADLLGARELRLSPGRLQLGERTLQVNQDGSAEIDYGGPFEDRFQRHSFFDVLNDRALKAEGKPRYLPPGAFRGKVVLVGGFAPGLADVKATPFSSAVPGVVKHAAEIDSLLRGGFIVQARPSVSIALALLVAALSAVLVLGARSIFVEIAWPVVLYAGFFAVSGLILVTTRVHVDGAMGMAAGILSSLSSIAANHLFANRERERMKQMFERYLSPAVVEQLADQPDLPKLTGEAVEISAFFSDIRGFSTFSEKYKDDPRGLVQILNTYLTRVSAALLQHGACLDKYIGDAVVCIFGAPVRHQDHALRACRGALAARAEVDRIRVEFREKGLPDVYTRIGVNTAVMFVGNVGSDQLFNYTAIGDGMNLAARLEGANKNYETAIMIGPRTCQMARDFIEVRELDRVRVAGKTEPVTVYELLCLKGELPEEKRRVVRLYEQALEHYRNERFDEALQVLDPILAGGADDGPSRALAARCRKYRDGSAVSHFDPITSLEK
ncbi:MAG TPA: adenylate/guanylate cyclase domain-containing protein [Myxococcaceae bacterium]